MRVILFGILACGALALGACGKTTSLTDAPHGDGAGADAASTTDATAAGPVTVVTYAEAGVGVGVASGVPVVFVEPNGAIEAEVPSDGSGVATATVLPGASVTVAYVGVNGATLYSVLAVAPGDHIDIGPFTAAPGATGMFTANVADNPGSVSYQVYGPCGSSSAAAAGSGTPTPVVLNISDDCKLATMDLVAVSVGTDGLTGYLDDHPVTYAAGGQTDMTGTWKPLQATTASYTDVPAAALASIGFLASVPDADGYEATLYNGVTGGSASATLQLPVGATSLFETDYDNVDDVGHQSLFDQVAGTPAAYPIDVGATLLPWLGVPALDPATGVVTTAVTGTGGGDVFDVDVEYSRTVNDQTQVYEWVVYGPTIGDVTLPPLPIDLASLAPAAGDFTGFGEADLYDADGITSWAQIREHLFDGLATYFEGRGVAPARVRYSYGETNAGFAPRTRGHRGRPAHRLAHRRP